MKTSNRMSKLLLIKRIVQHFGKYDNLLPCQSSNLTLSKKAYENFQSTNYFSSSKTESVESSSIGARLDDFLWLTEVKRGYLWVFVSWQERPPPSTPRLTSPLQRWPTKSARSMPWVGRRACTLWSWEGRVHLIDFFITEMLISAGGLCPRPAGCIMKHLWGGFWVQTVPKRSSEVYCGMRSLSCSIFWIQKISAQSPYSLIQTSLITKQLEDGTSSERSGAGSGAIFQSWSILWTWASH